MATFTALIYSALATAVASLDLHELVKNPSLSRYQDPSRFIWNDSDVYLLRASVPADTARNITHTPCVRSRYWSNTTEKVERSLDVYNKTNFSSTNISLTVEKHDTKTILNVDPKEQSISLKNSLDITIGISLEKYNRTFLVLFSDANCLILADTLKTEKIKRPWLRCSMWLTKNRIEKPPKCCQFIFELLCAYKVDTLEFFNKSCLNQHQESPDRAKSL
uniref:Putative serotonin and histamine binding protein n=1 Tax=Rhipicephalus haemaphysaloides haemaphysaloides TaxID=237075 RepID=Q2VIW8_RHIHE|nr:putative serotonin and histamine binding protein [Rhipicephalus haemaphysaloides haemaphysaloides]